ncbi:hypothetical protein MMC14_005835 [Varicellaria rhodocarpa]|nr:hypothetical protein [Varicellaria rhodocarpa]
MPRRNALLHQKFGPLVRIGPNHVSASSEDAVQVIHRAKTGFNKSSIYGILQPRLHNQILHNVFSEQDPAIHARLKRTMGSLYTTTAATELEFHIDSCVRLFTSRMEEFAREPGKAVNMSAWLQYYAFDSLGEVNFSRKLGFLASGTDVDGICELDHKQMMYFALMGQSPTLERCWSRISSLAGARAPNPLYTFTLNAVNERKNNPMHSTDMLNSFLALHKASPEKFSIREVIAATYINVVTAHDVLAITLRAILYYLCRNLSASQKLCEEIIQADRSKLLSKPAKYTEASGLKYLSAVILEALRIHPSTGLILERLVPKEGVVLHGKHIVEGTIIGVNCWVMNRDQGIFGDDAESFRPERWIDNEPQVISRMRRNLFTFSTGSRNCIGKNLAMMQITKIIVEIYRNFEVRLFDPSQDWHVSGGWLTRQTQMDMILESRRVDESSHS